MASFNKVILMGNLTRDPDLRSTPSGSAVCELGLAMNRRFVVNGQERDESCFVDVTVWGKSAENCKRFLEKGSPVLVEGRLQLDQWEDREGGGKRSKLRVVAETVQFLGSRRDGAGAPPDGGYAAPPQGAYNGTNSNYGNGGNGSNGSNGSNGGGNYGGGNYGNSGAYNNAPGGSGRPYEPRPYQGRPAPEAQAAPRGNMPPQSRPPMPPPMPDAAFDPGTDAEEDIPF